MNDCEDGWRAARDGSPLLPSMALDSIDAGFAVPLRQRELSDVFEHKVALSRRGEYRREGLARIDHSGRRHRLDSRGTRDARAEMAVASHHRIETTEHGTGVQRDPDLAGA